MQKLLTVGIPTYNGEKCISWPVESVLNQLKGNSFLAERVELLISDNASDDNVALVVEEYRTNHPDNVRYYRNETNVGFDNNVNLVVRRAEGRFVWILSDDDFILKGALEMVLDVIDRYQDNIIAVIFANLIYNERLKDRRPGSLEDGNSFYIKSGFRSGLISTNIVAKSVWLSTPVEKYIGTGWIHFGYLLEALRPENRLSGYVIYKEILQQGQAMRWGEGGTFIYTGFILVNMFKTMPSLGYARETCKKAVFSIKGSYPRNIPLAKAKGLKMDWNLIRKFYELYKEYPSFWLIYLPLLVIPNRLFYMAYIFAQKIRNHKK
jgi:abequosyltransferase